MWLAPIAQLLALGAMAPPGGTAASAPAQAVPEPVATRQTLFAIPFRVDPADRPSREPMEVHLYVSANQGRTWQLYDKVAPTRRRFVFQAGADGEYWFLARTLDRSGQLWPKQPNAPELRVLVDTMPPKLQLQAEQGGAGQITARWQIDEPHPRPGSLMIQYRTTTDGPLQQVAIAQQHQINSGSPQTGKVTWWPQAGSGTIQIRAEVADLAGNRAVSHAQVKLTPDAGGPPPRTAGGPASPWRAATPGPTATPWPAEPSAGSVGAANQTEVGPTGPDQAENPGGPENYGGNRYANDHYANYRYPNTGAALTTYPDAPTGSPFSVDRHAASGPTAGSIRSDVNPPIQSEYAAPNERNEDLSGAAAPPDQRPRMVNSRVFELDYDVTSVGPSGISRVELWATQDGGRSWRSLTLDDDNRSPLLVKIDQEGIYGLKVVVTSGAGLGGNPPQTGELPEIIVGVDLTKPTARITAAEPGIAAESGDLVICWQADDKMLAARPVSLLFSESPGGPWTTIAAGLENTGRYTWAIDNRVPQRVYLRLEVRDEAGNVGTFETAKSVPLDRFRPTVQIRDIHPLGQSRRTPPQGFYRR